MKKLDLLIEKYKKELLQAKKKSILPYEEENKTVQQKNPIENILNKSDFSKPESEMDEYKKTEKEKNKDAGKEKNTSENKEKFFGKLKVQVFAADKAFPVESASIKVYNNETKEMIFDGYSDSSGIVDDIVFETPSSEVSQSPSDKKTFSKVDIIIDHPDYVKLKYKGVPIFNGIESVQTVQMIPYSIENEDDIVINQSEPFETESEVE